MNQQPSTERANNVTEFLEHKGGIPLTNMLAPGAMGTSKQVASDPTSEGQADDRRVTVKILQNKGIEVYGEMGKKTPSCCCRPESVHSRTPSLPG